MLLSNCHTTPGARHVGQPARDSNVGEDGENRNAHCCCPRRITTATSIVFGGNVGECVVVVIGIVISIARTIIVII